MREKHLDKAEADAYLRIPVDMMLSSTLQFGGRKQAGQGIRPSFRCSVNVEGSP
jgi:hypothetical protein